MANTDPIVLRQKSVGGIDIYHAMGFKGQDYNVMHLESSTSPHGLGCTEDILDIAPGCKVYRTGSSILRDSEKIKQADCYYDGKIYAIEDFIREFKIKIVTKSVGGPSNDPVMERYWQNLIDRYNIIIVTPAGNHKFTIAFPAKVSIIVGAVGQSDKGIINPKSYTGKDEEVDFAYFTGDQEGTSFAAPRLVGVMLILMSRFGDRSQQEIYEMLKVLAKDVDVSGVDVKTGWGVPILHADDDIRLKGVIGDNPKEEPKEGDGMIVQLIPTTAKGRRPQIPMKAEYITIHSTGNPYSTAKNEAMNVINNHPSMQVSFHIVVDENDAYNVIPLNEVAWHAGDGKGNGNTKSIGIEICESGDRAKTLQNALEVVRYVRNTLGIGVDKIVQHNHWSGKDCPRILRNPAHIKGGLDWNWFMAQLDELAESKEILKTKAGISDATIDYLEKYKFGKELIKKLAKAMK